MIRCLRTALIALSFGISTVSLTAHTAPRNTKSTITFGKSEKLQVTASKKRNFKQDIEAVNKAHNAWKKAHLNKILYMCQRNSEETANLARKVADKMEAAKNDSTNEAQQLMEGMSSALIEANDPAAALLTDEQRAQLRAKLELVERAKKRSLILERLALQVKAYYENDAPKTSPFTGSCKGSYRVALSHGLEASSHYYQDVRALTQKIDGMAERARNALLSQPAIRLFAGGR